MTIAEVWGFIQTGGIAGLLFLALVGVFRGWWVPGYMLRDMERDRDEWKAIAMENIKTASTAVDNLTGSRARASK